MSLPLAWVTGAVGLTVLTDGVPGALGDRCWIDGAIPTPADIVGFRADGAVLMPLAPLQGLRPGARVVGCGRPGGLPSPGAARGRVLDGIGRPRDAGPAVRHGDLPRQAETPPLALRRAYPGPWVTGIRVLDALVTLARGQRVGIFAGPGVGKTTLLHDLLAHATYDLAVVGLIGERGREAAAFWRGLPADTRRRTATVLATADDPPLMRLHAMDVAARWAAAAAWDGANVLLIVDSVTRAAHAAREVGLATGEPAAARGYPPSLFARLPRWFEQAGAFAAGTVTALYTVLLDADDPDDPVGDAVRGLLDGHIVLDRQRAERHAFPAVDPLRSLSRPQLDLLNPTQQALVRTAREALGRAAELQDMVAVGAYQPGRDPSVDQALRRAAAVQEWSRQPSGESTSWEETWRQLSQLLQETDARSPVPERS